MAGRGAARGRAGPPPAGCPARPAVPNRHPPPRLVRNYQQCACWGPPTMLRRTGASGALTTGKPHTGKCVRTHRVAQAFLRAFSPGLAGRDGSDVDSGTGAGSLPADRAARRAFRPFPRPRCAPNGTRTWVCGEPGRSANRKADQPVASGEQRPQGRHPNSCGTARDGVGTPAYTLTRMEVSGESGAAAPSQGGFPPCGGLDRSDRLPGSTRLARNADRLSVRQVGRSECSGLEQAWVGSKSYVRVAGLHFAVVAREARDVLS